MSSRDQRRQLEAQREEREKTREENRHLSQLQFDSQGQLSRQTLESLIETDKLQPGTQNMLRNYLDRNWMLSNLSDAEAHDQRYKLDVMKLKVLGSHPPEHSAIQGPLRAYLMDDPDAGLWPLGPTERNEIDSFFDSLKMIVTRGRGGFERIQLNTQFRESRTETMRDSQGGSSGGRLRGLFSRG